MNVSIVRRGGKNPGAKVGEWQTFLLEGEDPNDPSMVKKAKAKHRRALREATHKGKKGNKSCRGCLRSFPHTAYKFSEPYHLPECSSAIRALSRVAAAQGAT